MQEIKRDYYLNQLISRRENGAIISGIRSTYKKIDGAVEITG